MKKYNRNKRAKYKTHARKIEVYDACDTHDTCDTLKTIKIPVRYDGYNHTQYDRCVIRYPHKRKAQIYVGMINAMHDVFPTQHTRHTHIDNAEYHTFIPQHDTDYMPPEHMMDEYTRNYTDIKRVKCIIYNKQNEMIHYGIFTRQIHMYNNKLTITLHRADRSIEVKLYTPINKIHGMTLQELRKYNVEIYQI